MNSLRDVLEAMVKHSAVGIPGGQIGVADVDYQSPDSTSTHDMDTSTAWRQNNPGLQNPPEDQDEPKGYSKGRGLSTFLTGALGALVLQPLFQALSGVKRKAHISPSRRMLMALLGGGTATGMDYLRDMIQKKVDQPQKTARVIDVLGHTVRASHPMERLLMMKSAYETDPSFVNAYSGTVPQNAPAQPAAAPGTPAQPAQSNWQKLKNIGSTAARWGANAGTGVGGFLGGLGGGAIGGTAAGALRGVQKGWNKTWDYFKNPTPANLMPPAGDTPAGGTPSAGGTPAGGTPPAGDASTTTQAAPAGADPEQRGYWFQRVGDALTPGFMRSTQGLQRAAQRAESQRAYEKIREDLNNRYYGFSPATGTAGADSEQGGPALEDKKKGPGGMDLRKLYMMGMMGQMMGGGGGGFMPMIGGYGGGGMGNMFQHLINMHIMDQMGAWDSPEKYQEAQDKIQNKQNPAAKPTDKPVDKPQESRDPMSGQQLMTVLDPQRRAMQEDKYNARLRMLQQNTPQPAVQPPTPAPTPAGATKGTPESSSKQPNTLQTVEELAKAKEQTEAATGGTPEKVPSEELPSREVAKPEDVGDEEGLVENPQKRSETPAAKAEGKKPVKEEKKDPAQT